MPKFGDAFGKNQYLCVDILNEQNMGNIITVIGGVNMDVSAAMSSPFVKGDSIPGKVTMSCGGVAHNIAHNLCLLGHRVRFVTVFGDDPYGAALQEICRLPSVTRRHATGCTCV